MCATFGQFDLKISFIPSAASLGAAAEIRCGRWMLRVIARQVFKLQSLLSELGILLLLLVLGSYQLSHLSKQLQYRVLFLGNQVLSASQPSFRSKVLQSKQAGCHFGTPRPKLAARGSEKSEVVRDSQAKAKD